MMLGRQAAIFQLFSVGNFCDNLPEWGHIFRYTERGNGISEEEEVLMPTIAVLEQQIRMLNRHRKRKKEEKQQLHI